MGGQEEGTSVDAGGGGHNPLFAAPGATHRFLPQGVRNQTTSTATAATTSKAAKPLATFFQKSVPFAGCCSDSSIRVFTGEIRGRVSQKMPLASFGPVLRFDRPPGKIRSELSRERAFQRNPRRAHLEKRRPSIFKRQKTQRT